MDQQTAKLQRLLLRTKPSVDAVTGPQEGVIVSADTGAGTCYFTVPKVGASFKYGPAPYPGGGITPTAGMRCLAMFVGEGVVGDPWIVALTTVPKPAGY